MTPKKGYALEEVVRTYLARQGFFALRSVRLRFEDEDVTDIDVWAYGRQAASLRTRTLVDVKDKRSPKAFERILWARGMQLALHCDRAIVATTDGSPKVVRFAQQQHVGLLSKQFLDRLQNKLGAPHRLTLEEFTEKIKSYPNQKQDGDWLKKLSDAKSAVVSLRGYPAFNKCMGVFRFFAERAMTRSLHKELAIRATYHAASLACVGLDAALEQVLYQDAKERYQAILAGVTYGDAGDARVQKSIDTVLAVLPQGMEKGRVVARQARLALDKMFENVRADLVAEFFSKEHNATSLFGAARELDECAHEVDPAAIQKLSVETRSVLGVLCDFVGVKRGPVLNGSSEDEATAKAQSAGEDVQSVGIGSEPEVQTKLL